MVKKVFFLVLLGSVFSCASVQVTHDYDSKADFSKYTTYNYFNDINSGLSELDERRLIRVLDSSLQAKGLTKAETPTFLIDLKSSVYQSTAGNSVGVGVGGTGSNVGGGVSIGIPVGGGSLKRQITFEFVETNSKATFWQGTGENSFKENVSPDDREAQLHAIVQKVLTKFPPKP